VTQRARPHPTAPDRVAAAWREVGHTEVHPATAWLLTIGFLVAIFSVPLIQLAAGGLSPRAADGAGDGTGAAIGSTAAPAATDSPTSWVRRLAAQNRAWVATLKATERAVGEQSLVAAWLRPWTQYGLARWLGAGNEQVYPGRDGWLFYRRSLEFVSGAPFPAPELPRTSIARYDERRQPRERDPLPAILDFGRQLDRRGIALVVVPVPPKPTVHPEKLTSRGAHWDEPVSNRAYSAFLDRLRQAGILVFDPGPLLVEARRRTGQPQYLAADTHWRPDAVVGVATALAAFLRRHVALPPRSSPGYRVRKVEVVQRGDLARLLDVPTEAAWYGPERVTLRQVLTARGELWQPDPWADVLVLGDSFTNIYAVPSLGWGTAAGLAEQLAYELRRPVDRIALNDNGAFAPRLLLQQELARGRDRLASKRVVVWQFVAHELAFGDWRRIALGPPPVQAPEFVTPRAGAELVVTGRVHRVGAVPRPGSVPYRDHIVAVHLTDLAGLPSDISGTHALVYVWSLQDNVPQLGARLRAGDRITLRLRPWSEVAAWLEGINRSELDHLLGVSPWWGEPESRR
jgi:hypothetical protein